jgi:hypothetical protein
LDFAEPHGQGPEREEAGDEDGDAGGVMPGRDGTGAFMSGDPRQQGRTRDIEKKRECKTRENAQRAAHGAQGIKLAQEEGDHQRGLERADAAARVINADHSGSDLDHIAMRNSRNPYRTEQLDGDADVYPHQSLNQRSFDEGRPRDSNEEETEGERDT